jgi:PleD family two-component response regulator
LDSAPAATPSVETEDAGDRGTASAVLVVEDEQAVRGLIRTVLEGEGYRVHEAANGREALGFWNDKQIGSTSWSPTQYCQK